MDLLFGLALGGAIAATAVFLTLRTRLRERDAAIAELKPAVEAARAKSDELQAQLRDAEIAKAHAEGAASATDDLRAQLDSKNEEALAYSRQVASLTGQVAEARQDAEGVRNASQAALRQKDAEMARLLESKEADVRTRLAEKDEAVTRLLAEKEVALTAQKRLLEETDRVLTEKFGAVSIKSLNEATEQFLRLATESFSKSDEASKADLEKRQREIEHLLEPLKETLDKIEVQHKEIEERRVSAFDAIDRGIRTLSQEADQLANALRKPGTRGAWGEMQLQIILENAGMIEGEHFTVQHSSDGDEGRQRTDVIVHMPHGRLFVIDSKAPLESYWEGMNAEDEPTRLLRFTSHARAVRDHVKKLANKSYWSRYATAPDCVVMFIPTEGAYQAAFEIDRSLISDAHQSRVYVANPMTLMSMVHVAAYVLNEEKLRQNAHEVRTVGIELYKRLCKFLGDLDGVGRHLKMAVGEYNKAIGSADGRLLPQARRMKELGAGSGDLPLLETIDADPRAVASPERAALPGLGL